MLHPPVEQLELDPRHSEEHREEEQRHCARITELQQLPGGPVDAIYDHIGGAERPTARQHHDERQHLERADDSGHQHEQRHGPEQRERHAPEALPGIRTVYASSVQVRLWDRPKAREEDRQLVAQLHPHGHEHHPRSAVLGSPSQLTGPSPARASTRLINPKSGWYIHRHTRATATTEEAYGSRNSTRSAGAPDLRRPPTASARPSASAIDTGTYRAYSSVRPSADQTRGSRTT